MTEISWAEQAVDRFFEGRRNPARLQCDQIARAVSGASDIRNVDTPGSMALIHPSPFTLCLIYGESRVLMRLLAKLTWKRQKKLDTLVLFNTL